MSRLTDSRSGPGTASAAWFLSGRISDDETMRQIPINATPFSIGRLGHHALCLPSPAVSKSHAEIVAIGESLTVRDLGSTNGTFLNGQRLRGDAVLREGDLLQVANMLFRVGRAKTNNSLRTIEEIPVDWVRTLVQFDKLMSDRAVVPFFQAVVGLKDLQPIGYEVLGRSELEGLESPAAMFSAAARLDQECPLSELLRSEGIRVGMKLPGRPNLFVNTHPAEIVQPELLASLEALRALAPGQPITIEIHEAAVTDLDAMRSLLDHLRRLDMQLAYDDFGAGQARLVEITEVPPDYVKFDINLIRNIDAAAPSRQQMLATLVKMVHDLGIAVVAEGIERPEELAVCRDLDFDLGQGYHFGRPAPLEKIVPTGTTVC